MSRKTIAFTGVQIEDLSEEQIYALANAIGQHTGRDRNYKFVSGAAHGIDTWCFWEAFLQFPRAYHHIIVPAQPKYNIHLVETVGGYLSELSPNITIEVMPKGTSYLDRDQRMVDLADQLMGTWATIRRARKKGIPVHLYPIDEL